MNKFIQILKNNADNNKYTKRYIALIDYYYHNKVNSVYTEKHHILPKSFSDISITDINNSDNIVILDARAHFIAHLLLTKMFTKKKLMNKKMNFAFFQMKLTNKFQDRRYINSRFYSKVKKQIAEYTRLYKGECVRYIDKNDILYNKKYKDYITDGYSLEMTPEFKVGRVGNMKGKKHSSKTKERMSIAAKRIIHYGLLNMTLEQKKAAINRGQETKKQKLSVDPHIYDESRARAREKTKELYRSGVLSNKGENNSRFGKSVSEKQRQKTSEIKQRRSNSGYTHKETYFMYVKPALDQGLTLTEIAIKHPYYTGSKANKAYHLRQVIKKNIQQYKVIDCI
jgi:hypothetical protein